jgi:glucan 1,3-beta-glucosidase
LYQYEFSNTQNIFMGFIQTETPYYQPHPNAAQFQSSSNIPTDPDFTSFCADRTNGTCNDAWALRILDTTNILCYGAGLYSFFNDHSTTCSDVGVEDCQTQIFGVDDGGVQTSGSSNVRMYNLNTVGSVAMITVGSEDIALQSDNTGPFPETVALFET